MRNHYGIISYHPERTHPTRIDFSVISCKKQVLL